MCILNDKTVVERLLKLCCFSLDGKLYGCMDGVMGDEPCKFYKSYKGYGLKVIEIDKKKCTVSEHRLIWSMSNAKPIPIEMVVDHIDNNPSNNHPSNLRLATPSDNAANCKPSYSEIKKGYRNITEKHSKRMKWSRELKTYIPVKSKYQAHVISKGKLYTCPWTDDFQLALMQARKLRIEHHGVYAYDY